MELDNNAETSDVKKSNLNSDLTRQENLTGNLNSDNKTKIIVALIVLVGTLFTGLVTIFVAIISGWFGIEPTRMIIAATATAEVNATQGAYIEATIEAARDDNLDQYKLSIKLPGEHSPPNLSGGAIPVSDITEKTAMRIKVPAIDVDAPIVQGDGWEDLKKGVGQKLGTVNPGDEGVIILSAYNDIYGEIFRELDKLQIGDEITIFSNEASYKYIVDHFEIVSSKNMKIDVISGNSILILTSQYPYLVDNQWITVYANLEN